MEAIDRFLENLKELMIDKNLSFEKLSNAVHINPRTMRRWYENRSPKLDSLIRLADYFSCSIDFLFGLTEELQFTPSVSCSNFITRYQSLLARNKLNDYKISKLCGIGTGTVSKWKLGKTPDTPILIKLCELFDCSFEYLIGRKDFDD